MIQLESLPFHRLLYHSHYVHRMIHMIHIGCIRHNLDDVVDDVNGVKDVENHDVGNHDSPYGWCENELGEIQCDCDSFHSFQTLQIDVLSSGNCWMVLNRLI